jgi:polyribonucleotide nucleotidyltransferase
MHVQNVSLLGRHLLKFTTTHIGEPGLSSLRVQMGSTVLLTTVDSQAHPHAEHASLSISLEYAEGFTYSAASSKKKLSHDREAILLDFIERIIRPIIPAEAPYDIRITIRVHSFDPEVEPEAAALLAASAALCIADIPLQGIVTAVNVGYVDGELVLNPSAAQVRESQLNLSIAGTELSVFMAEGQASELAEDTVLEAIIFGYRHIQVAIGAIDDFARRVKGDVCTWRPRPRQSPLAESISVIAKEALEDAYQISDRRLRDEQIRLIQERVIDEHVSNRSSDSEPGQILRVFNELENAVVRQHLLNGRRRLDGRRHDEIRPFKIEVGPLRKPPGSALYSWGQSNVLATASLTASGEDNSSLDPIAADGRLAIHYNVHPVLSPRIPDLAFTRYREIEVGLLARKAIEPVFPGREDFSSGAQVFSDISDFDSATSMASISAACLALMDAGIPLKRPVAGVAMAVLSESSRFVMLSDVLSEEELIADMALKVAGTERGITAFRMDIKIHALSLTVIQAALRQACKARLEMLDHLGNHIELAFAGTASGTSEDDSRSFPEHGLSGKGRCRIETECVETVRSL